MKMLKPFKSFHSQYNNHLDQFQELLENPLAHVSLYTLRIDLDSVLGIT